MRGFGFITGNGFQQTRRFAGQEGNFNQTQRTSDAFASGFEQGFLAGPEIEEGRRFLFGANLLKEFAFTCGEKSRDKFIHFLHRTNTFAINADHSDAGHGDEREVFCVSEVEMDLVSLSSERLSTCLGEKRRCFPLTPALSRGGREKLFSSCLVVGSRGLNPVSWRFMVQ